MSMSLCHSYMGLEDSFFSLAAAGVREGLYGNGLTLYKAITPSAPLECLAEPCVDEHRDGPQLKEPAHTHTAIRSE